MDDTPISYLALEVGTLVQTSSGKTIGTVEHVLQIPEEDLFDGIVVATDHGLRFVDRDQNSRDHTKCGALPADRRRSCSAPRTPRNPNFPRQSLPGRRVLTPRSLRSDVRQGALDRGQVGASSGLRNQDWALLPYLGTGRVP